ncbi:MAG: glycosyltransferase family 4 protein [Clostridiales bacterium]|nr:glycosyltransferase family 4 protein [Clostridiales bacterium]
MNIIYLTLDDFESLNSYRSINTDLLRVFRDKGHKVYVISPEERKKGGRTRLIEEDGAYILKPRIGNIQKTNFIEKGISTVTIGSILNRAVNRYLSGVHFDLIMYCTPPITFLSTIRYLKKRDGAKTYLILKDIFPQNAVDIGILGESGIKGLLFKYFRDQEKKLYKISDKIGCMSPANIRFVIEHNPEIDPSKVEECPNCVEVSDKSVTPDLRFELRSRYGIPQDKTVFVYGGNLGRPQGIPFLIECLKKCSDIKDAFFLIVGNGTEYGLLDEYVKTSGQKNVKLMSQLPRDDYDNMVGACDIGMIFLDHRFTIPNFPSRMLSYMAAGLPVLACTDRSTDLGKVITEGGFGWWRESNDADKVRELILEIIDSGYDHMGDQGFDYLNMYYPVTRAYDIIIKNFEEREGI